MKHGLVVSDFHQGAPYAAGDDAWASLRSQLGGVDMCVLNGDLFENMIRWDDKPLDELAKTAVSRMKALMDEFPGCEFHFVIGNHEFYHEFIGAMKVLESQHPNRLHLHERYFRMGNALFVHGNQHIYPQAYKDPFERPMSDRQRNPLHQTLHVIGNVLVPRVARFIPRFSLRPTAQKILHTLKEDERKGRTSPGEKPLVLKEIQHIFFGDTHVPATHVEIEGIHFHNTGAAILFDPPRLNMLRFNIEDNHPAFPQGKIHNIAPCLDKSDLQEKWGKPFIPPGNTR